MLRTDEIRCKVAGSYNGHYWLEVLDPREQGMRVSVPAYHDSYSENGIKKAIENWEIGDVLTVVLFSKTESPPQWRVEKIIESDNSDETGHTRRDQVRRPNDELQPRA